MNYTITDKVRAKQDRERKTERNAEIIRLYDEENLTMYDLAKKFNISAARVSFIYKKYKK